MDIILNFNDIYYIWETRSNVESLRDFRAELWNFFSGRCSKDVVDNLGSKEADVTVALKGEELAKTRYGVQLYAEETSSIWRVQSVPDSNIP